VVAKRFICKFKKTEKMKTKTLVITGCLFGIILISCNKPPEKGMEDAKEEIMESHQDLNEANEKYNAEFKEYKLEQEKMILENKEKIADLKEKKKEVGTENRAKYDARIDELEQKNNRLNEKLSKYNYESKENWESFKNEFNHDMGELGQSFKDLFKNNVK
jgi:Skp family chaperone for outer membrane proteins